MTPHNPAKSRNYRADRLRTCVPINTVVSAVTVSRASMHKPTGKFCATAPAPNPAAVETNSSSDRIESLLTLLGR